MPYYAAGDYYMAGDYYQGDPFSLGGFLKGFARAATGFVTGGPVGAAQAVLRDLSRGRPATTSVAAAPVAQLAIPQLPAPAFIPMQQTGVLNVGGPNEKQTGVINIQKGGGPLQVPGMKGYHLNKSTYETRGGGTSRWGGAGTLSLHQKGTVLVKNRRLNVGNARAVRHAVRRLYGFERLARRVLRITSPRKRHVFHGFKTRKRK